MKPPLLIAAVILCGAVRTAATQEPTPSAPDGQALYQQSCRGCHGATGVPSQRMMTMYKNLRPLDSAYLATRSVDSLIVVIRDGIGDMKPYKDKLTPEQIAAIARYTKTLGASKSP